MNSILQQAARRFISKSAASAAQIQGTAATAGHEAGGYKLWKRLSFFVAVPGVLVCALNAYLKHQEHAGAPRPPFIKMDYLRKRDKRFPWGDGKRSLFHNPHVNPLPDGYEH